MPAEPASDLKFEIGHVLFIDIVGCSKLLINEQSEQIQTLRDIVRGTEQFRLAEAEGKLVRLPTGNGMSSRVTQEGQCSIGHNWNQHRVGRYGKIRSNQWLRTWAFDNAGLIENSKGHFDSAEYERQLKRGIV